MTTIIARSVPGWLPRAARSGVESVDGPALAKGERPLVTIAGPSGSPVVATERAVYHHRQAPGGWARLGWEQVGHLRWDGHDGGLVLAGWTPQAPPRTVLAVPRNHVLVALARERVAWTMLTTAVVELAGHGHARVTARRQPGTDRLLWRVVLGDGVRDGPAVRAETQAAVARLRAELGR